MNNESYVIGVDYGTDSVRTIIVRTDKGTEIASSVFQYPRWADGLYCDPVRHQFRQHPLDYTEGLTHTIRHCLQQAGASVTKNIKAISIDTTGSTPVAVGKDGMPLSLHPEFSDNPDAMFILWKDHSSMEYAERINEHAKEFETDYLKYVGGIYSSEWFWSKLLYVLNVNAKVRGRCYSWVEHCDWMPFLLTGGKTVSQIKRSVCTAGHKALWSDEWNGLPPEEFFSSLDPLLTGFRNNLFSKTYTADQAAGTLCGEWAEKLGLSTNVFVGVGAMDAHMGAVGGQIEPYYLSKVIGTSTCDMLVVPHDEFYGRFVSGICGQVDGSIIPGMIGLEAGQSAFGDVYAWFKQLLTWPLRYFSAADIATASDKILIDLNNFAAQIPVKENMEFGVDWFNGRRTPDANPYVGGAMMNLNLATDAPAVFRCLVESTCFGAKAIVDRFLNEGVQIKGLIGIGGVAKKSPFIMQTMADVMNMPIRINKSEQTCALGAAMFAATVAGCYERVEDAMAAMGQGFEEDYAPNETNTSIYTARYKQYLRAGNFIEELNTRKNSLSCKKTTIAGLS
jgi:L-ribulokinase